MQTIHGVFWFVKSAFSSALAITLCASMADAQEPLRLGPGRASKKGQPKENAIALAETSRKPAPPSAKSMTPSPEAAPLELPTPYSGSREGAWDTLFASRSAKEKTAVFYAAVRAKVRRLVAAQDFIQIKEILFAALRHDAVQPWMYEALALATEASGGSKKELERVILSAVDVNRDIATAITTADYLASLELDEAAIRLYQDIASQDPNLTEPYLHGLKSAQRLKNFNALRWCCVGVLQHAWPSDQREVETQARRLAEATILDLEAAGDLRHANELRGEIAAAQLRDVRVRVWWTGDADVDLSVLEPTGEVCSYRNPRTSGGGQILGDSFARSNTNAPREGYSETFLAPEGFSGEYQVLLKRVWGEVAGGKVNVEVVTHLGAKDEVTIARQLPLVADGTLVKFELKDGRRKTSLTTARAERATARQVDVARHLLAQTLSSSRSESASSAYYAEHQPFALDAMGRLIVAPRIGTGFRPQVTTLQDGPLMIAGPAVVSADRRFVRVHLSPQFRTIGEVQTFNFATGAVGNGNGTGNTGGTSGGFGNGGNSGGTGGGAGGNGGVGT